MEAGRPAHRRRRLTKDEEQLTESGVLAALGATQVSQPPCREHGTTWLLMADPEGNELCVCDADQPPS